MSEMGRVPGRPGNEPRLSCTGCVTRYSVELIRCPTCRRPTRINRAHWRRVAERQRAVRDRPDCSAPAILAAICASVALVVLLTLVLVGLGTIPLP